MSQALQPIRLSISKLASLSDAQLRALDHQRQAAPECTVPVSSLPASTQFALVSISSHPVAMAVTAKLRRSTMRSNGMDFETLRRLGLAVRMHGARWHKLTEQGQDYARGCAVRIAKDLGLHEIWETGSFDGRTAHCTCGFSTTLRSSKGVYRQGFGERIEEHLAEAAKGAT